ncbi:Hemolysin activation/secretion protein [Izhakiella capsodis]|uniref:Hemolysin activation/secretion protein n=1 Tax=Izhakiella capsodis TaxID=1367852 RepID=A0A1I4XG91_9GAMM|nr:ShlB/FhaC/HecB family hemolysin secretion/activation protein [Izhakiella capsodis]SFN24279.1 Hemolysin activation/secretion protein [Izhakiella capsodis]
MELRFKILSLFLLSLCFHVDADDDINNLIKQQQNADVSAFKEQALHHKSVFSSAESKVFRLDNFPEEKNCFTIKSLLVKNGFLQRKTNAVIQREVIGRCVGNIGVTKIATALQDYYINAGYITTRVELPSQNISSGTLTLIVEPGKIEKVIVENDDVIPWMLPFKKDEILNIRDIEQGLENLQQVPNVNVKINIEPGTQKNYSDIRIATHRTKNWNVRASYNNWGNKATGRYLSSVVGFLYNPARFSDLFYLAGTQSTTGKYKNISGYYSLPVGYWNYTLFYSSSQSRQVVPLSYTSVEYRGKSDYWSAKASRTFYRDKSRKFTANAELIHRKSRFEINGQELLLQKRDMENVKFGINYKQQLNNAYWDSTVSWQRFVTWFGATKTPDMVYGNVSPVSHIFNIESNYMKQFGSNIYTASFFAQYAPHELTLQDQMTLGNRWTIRGFENSVGLNGNNGFYLQNTLYHPAGFLNAQYYLGIDAGQIKKDNFYGDEILIGSAVGIQGSVKSLTWDASVSVPAKYPRGMDVDILNFNFNVSYQL